MTIYKSPICSCVICHKEYSNKGIDTHYHINHIEGNMEKHKSSKIKPNYKIKTICFNKGIIKWKEYYSNPRICDCCGNEIDWFRRKNKCCSHSCSAIIANKQKPPRSKESRNKTSKSLTGKTKNIGYRRNCLVSWCVICNSMIKNKNRKTCSKECLHILSSDNARKNPGLGTKRSKDEIALYELCKNHFNIVKHNKKLFNGWDADILIYDTKTAILWNGPWHYREMNLCNHSLEKVQHRDKIKLNEIEKYGWNAIIFEDRYFSPNSAFTYLLLSLL